ncbi:hypothetical protein [Clostridium sp.]|uniref:hypothetical protein n=1 Tax=Clostridium sp. TaxID=1506 RepID=UPI003D6C95E4
MIKILESFHLLSIISSMTHKDDIMDFFAMSFNKKRETIEIPFRNSSFANVRFS